MYDGTLEVMSNLLSAAVIAAVLGGISGGVTSHFAKRSEFRRDQRLKVYASFVKAFMNVTLSGSYLQSVSMTHGPPHEPGNPDYAEAKRNAYMRAFELHSPNRSAFAEVAAELRIIASADVRAAAEEVEDWVQRNVHSSPPFAIGFETAGELSKIGPSAVENGMTVVVRTFADAARVDVVGSD